MICFTSLGLSFLSIKWRHWAGSFPVSLLTLSSIEFPSWSVWTTEEHFLGSLPARPMGSFTSRIGFGVLNGPSAVLIVNWSYLRPIRKSFILSPLYSFDNHGLLWSMGSVRIDTGYVMRVESFWSVLAWIWANYIPTGKPTGEALKVISLIPKTVDNPQKSMPTLSFYSSLYLVFVP